MGISGDSKAVKFWVFWLFWFSVLFCFGYFGFEWVLNQTLQRICSPNCGGCSVFLLEASTLPQAASRCSSTEAGEAGETGAAGGEKADVEEG